MSRFEEQLRAARAARRELVGRDADVQEPRSFLMIWFKCCNAYGRIYRNADATAYKGRCPKCGANVRARIGPDGTSRRIFTAE